MDQADCTLLLTPSGKSVLFDCGDAGWNSTRELRQIAPQLEAMLGTRHLDYVVVTHLQVDHVGYPGYGGLWGLVESYDFSVGNLLVRDYTSYPGDVSTKAYGLWKEYFASHKEELGLRILHLGETVNVADGVTLTVCSADGNGFVPSNLTSPACPVSENELSVGVLVSFLEFQEWIGGDLGGTCIERQFGPECEQYSDVETSAAARAGDVEVLRVNHHGSVYSSNSVFLGNLDPEVSIISVGETRSYGHPDQGVLERLSATSDVYLTTSGNDDGAIRSGKFDLSAHPNVFVDQGNILIETDGIAYTVNGRRYLASTPARLDRDGDGYFAEVDPDDEDPDWIPPRNAVP